MAKELSIALIITLLVISCAGVEKSEEERIRAKLGVPDNAERVLIIGQSSHLDLDWLTSFDNYYEHFVKPIFISALDFLEVNSGHYYAIAEVSFIKRFVIDNPEGRGEEFINRVKDGRLVILGGGFSSPDNLLPDGEAIIMNYLKGKRWLEDITGQDVQVLSVWLPDDFGHSPSLPDILSSMGFRYVGFGRTDGMDTTLKEISGERVLREGSTAKRLMDDRSIDFIWRGRKGEVIAHWMPFSLYCQGDTIDFIGQPLPGGFLGLYMGYDEEFTNSKIAEFIDQLSVVSPTPYMFLPVGCDFTFPKMHLYKYVERWNEKYFKESGVWVTVGSFEDYMKLVNFHRDELKSYQFDMNPYFTGFYASRPYLKELFYKAEMNSLALEAFLAFKGQKREEMDDIWEKVSFATHHDFITGTSPIQVVEGEQIPLLEGVLEEIDNIVNDEMAGYGYGERLVVFNPYPRSRPAYMEIELNNWSLPSTFVGIGEKGYGFVKDGILYAEIRSVPPFGISSYEVQSVEPSIPFSVEDYGDRLLLHTPFYEVAFSKKDTFYLASLKAGENLLLRNSGVIRSYMDEGGLWRIGSEMEGCVFSEMLTSPPYTYVKYYLSPLTAYVESEFLLEGENMKVNWIFFRILPYITIRLKGKAPLRRTITINLDAPVQLPSVFTTVPHGIRSITSERFFIPTFWSTNGGIFLLDEKRGYMGVLNRPSGVRWNGKGEVEVMVFRNAPRERCESLGTVTEKTGQDDFIHSFEMVLNFLNGDENEDTLFSFMRSIPLPFFVKAGASYEGSDSVLQVNGCVPLMVKNTENNDGIILRVIDFDTSGCEVESSLYKVSEENLNSLEEYTDVLEDNVIKNILLRRE